MAAADVAAAMAVPVVVAVVVAMWLVPKEEAVQAEAVAAKALEMSVAVAAAAAMSVTVVAVAVATSMANAADVLLQARRQKCIRTTSGNRAGDRALINSAIRLNQTQSDAIDSGAHDRDTPDSIRLNRLGCSRS